MFFKCAKANNHNNSNVGILVEYVVPSRTVIAIKCCTRLLSPMSFVIDRNREMDFPIVSKRSKSVVDRTTTSSTYFHNDFVLGCLVDTNAVKI